MEIKIEKCPTWEHEYAEITCPHCGSEDNCWSCSVNCTNNSTGEGFFKCHSCGYKGYYKSREVYPLD